MWVLISVSSPGAGPPMIMKACMPVVRLICVRALSIVAGRASMDLKNLDCVSSEHHVFVPYQETRRTSE